MPHKDIHSKELLGKLQKMLEHNTAAIDFVIAYGRQADIADDLVDEILTKPEQIKLLQELTSLSARIYSSDYWTANRQALLMVEMLNNITYFDTVAWENSSENWKRKEARCLNHCAYNMLFAVLIIECGPEKVIQSGITLEFRESVHKAQKDDITLLPSVDTESLLRNTADVIAARARFDDNMLAEVPQDSNKHV